MLQFCFVVVLVGVIALVGALALPGHVCLVVLKRVKRVCTWVMLLMRHSFNVANMEILRSVSMYCSLFKKSLHCASDVNEAAECVESLTGSQIH